MNRKEKIAEVVRVVKLVRDVDAAYDATKAGIGCDIEAPLWQAVFAMQAELIKQAAKLIGDQYDWLDWFVYENDCGTKGLEAGFERKLRKIRTPADIVRLIEETQDE